MAVETLSSARSFGGEQLRFQHRSEVLGCDMVFSVFLPPQARKQRVPVLYFLSGLTCTDENMVQKAGAQRYAAEHGIALVAPDTSPRGDDVPDDPDGAWDFGVGAGFYINATQAPWSNHYRMYDYVVHELPTIVDTVCEIDSTRASITGHSMGGHGALTIGLREGDRYRSISAFAPICAPTECPWGEKAFSRYLGDDRTHWVEHDACQLLMKAKTQRPILVDQGTADSFLREQLKPERLLEASTLSGYPITLRMQAGYDHSYFFIASFIGEHIAFHAEHLHS